MSEKKEQTLFDNMDQFSSQHKEWKDMPEFVKENLEPWKTLMIHFENRNDMEEFAKLINQKITFETKSLWYPKKEKMSFLDKIRYADEKETSKDLENK